MLTRKDFLIRGSAAAGAGLLAAACGPDNSVTSTTFAPTATTSGGTDQVHFILDWIPKGQTSPFYMALEKGFWAERNLSVTVSRGYGSGDTSVRIGTGEGDFGWAGVSAVMNTISEGLPLLEIAATAHTHPQGWYSTFPINSAADIVGRRGAINPAGEDVYIVRAWCKENGIDFDNDVDWIFVDGAGMNEIITGEAEFVTDWVSNIPEWWLQEPPIEPNVGWFAKDVGIYGNGVISRPETLQQRPDVARRFVEGAMEGYKYVLEGGNDAHEESIDALFKYNPNVAAAGETARDFHLGNLKMWIGLMLSSTDLQEHGIGYWEPAKTEKTLNWINEWLLETPLAMDEAFDTSFVGSGDFMVDNYDEAVASVATVLGRPNPLLS